MKTTIENDDKEPSPKQSPTMEELLARPIPEAKTDPFSRLGNASRVCIMVPKRDGPLSSGIPLDSFKLVGGAIQCDIKEPSPKQDENLKLARPLRMSGLPKRHTGPSITTWRVPSLNWLKSTYLKLSYVNLSHISSAHWSF